MKWRKDFGYAHHQNIDYILVAITLFALIGIFTRQPVLYLIIGVFVAYLLLHNWFDKRIGEKLNLHNEPNTIRLFPEEEDRLTFLFQNHSILPMVNGQLELRFKRAIRILGYRGSDDQYWRRVSIPFSILGKKKTMLELPIRAEERGVTKISHIDYVFPHLFNFQTVKLSFTDSYQTEVLVFPKLIPVHGLETAFQMTPGSQRITFSPFEDVQSPLGTKDYSFSDPFHRINWKASVKTQRLQTNVYEKVVDQTFLLIVNIGDQPSEGMEDLLSYTAYLTQTITEKGFPFEVYLNARKPGNIPFVHVPEGEGKLHYRYTLDMLARIERHSLSVSFSHMLHRVGQQLVKPKTIIVVGDISEASSQIIGKWEQGQHQIFHIDQTKDGALLKPWMQQVKTYAK